MSSRKIIINPESSEFEDSVFESRASTESECTTSDMEIRPCTPPKVALYRYRKCAVSADKTPLANQSFNLSTHKSNRTGSLSTSIGEPKKPQNRLNLEGDAFQKKAITNSNDIPQDSMASKISFASNIGRYEQKSTEFKFTLPESKKRVQALWKTSNMGKRHMNRMNESMSLNETFSGGSCTGFFKEHDSGFTELEKFERDLLADVPPNAKYIKGQPVKCALHNVNRKYLIRTFPAHVDIMTLIRKLN